ncbi:MAG: hypothetical protein JF589_11215 [Gemmatimonadetes bacterium]|nr:hypothetical protein [Gemmatimonadota bacterium]
MNEKKRRSPKKRAAVSRSPYFLQPGKQGAVTVYRRPAGNRIDAKLCGTMPSRAMALALVKQLERAESVVHDLFLEATDDGIEALEAVLEACRQSVTRRAPAIEAGVSTPRPAGGKRRGRGRRRGARRAGSADDAPAAEPADGSADPSAA